MLRNPTDRSLIALALVCVAAVLLMATPALMRREMAGASADRPCPAPAVAAAPVCAPRVACASAY